VFQKTTGTTYGNFEIPPDADGGGQTGFLNQLLAKCYGGAGDAPAVEHKTIGGLILMVDNSDLSAATALLQASLTEFTRGEGWELELQIQNVVSVDRDECAAAVAGINGALRAFLDGTFAECEMTTPTTSLTSTQTTTVTSSASTSPSTSATTTITSTPTTTSSTSPTSTATASPTSTQVSANIA
jgi:hypothetical protein